MISRSKEGKEYSEQFIGALGQIVAGYLTRNPVESSEIGSLIHQVFSALSNLNTRTHQGTATQPAVDVNKSVTPDYIICLEDGKKLKMLKRHLRTAYGLTPEQYRERWDLPLDYPMVAPNYAQRRSSLAKSNGLGRPRKGYTSLNTGTGLVIRG
jgi:predicted transcriptional regulator